MQQRWQFVYLHQLDQDLDMIVDNGVMKELIYTIITNWSGEATPSLDQIYLPRGGIVECVCVRVCVL